MFILWSLETKFNYAPLETKFKYFTLWIFQKGMIQLDSEIYYAIEFDWFPDPTRD